MKYPILVIMIILLAASVSSAQYLSLSSTGKVRASGKFMCYYDYDQGIVCPDVRTKHLSSLPFREDPEPSKECFFDRTRGAVCPGVISTGAFRPRRYAPYGEQIKESVVLPRLSKVPPASISGSFSPRFDPPYLREGKRHHRARQRLPFRYT